MVAGGAATIRGDLGWNNALLRTSSVSLATRDPLAIIDRMSYSVEHLERAAREHILAQMPDDPSGELAAMDLAALLISYNTWRGRLIPAQPRRCHLSPQLAGSQEAVEHKSVLDAIVAKIEAGDDLKPHLSRAVLVGHDPNGRTDRDPMLSDYGVHHLHLSTNLDGEGFVKRTKDLLFAAFRPGDAYLIGIYQHVTDWAKEDILKTIARNWPDIGIAHELRSVIGLTWYPSDDQRLELRKGGIASAPVEVDGKFFMTIGQTLAGTSMRATQTSNLVMHAFREWQEKGDERVATILRVHEEATGLPVTGPWQIAVYNESIGYLRDDIFYGIAQLS